MEKKQKVLEVAKYIIEKTATIKMTADHFGMSTSSIKKYINNDLKDIDEDIYNKVKIVQKNLEEYGRIVGGMNGIREPKITEFEALEIARQMITNDWTIAQTAEYYEIPTSTIYDLVTKIDDDKVQDRLKKLFEDHKKRN